MRWQGQVHDNCTPPSCHTTVMHLPRASKGMTVVWQLGGVQLSCTCPLFNVSKVFSSSPWSVGRKHRSTSSPNTPHNTIQTPPTPPNTIMLRCCCKTRHHMCILYMQLSALPCCRTRHHMCIFYMQLSALPKFKKQQTGSTQIIHATRHRQTNGCACVCLSGPLVCCWSRVVN